MLNLCEGFRSLLRFSPIPRPGDNVRRKGDLVRIDPINAVWPAQAAAPLLP